MQPKLKIISVQRKKEPTHQSINKHPTKKKKKKSKGKKRKGFKKFNDPQSR